jgi:signal transduction histidine kinase
MNLVPKLAASLVSGTFLVLAANAYLRVDREVGVLQTDRVRDHALLGRSLGSAVAAVWRSDGRAEALKVVDGANARGGKIQVRWVEGRIGAEASADPASLASLAPGVTSTRLSDRERVSYTPVAISGERMGFVELTEPLDAERLAKHQIVVDTVLTVATMVFVCGVLALAMGVVFVGRPIRALCDKARQTGTGDFAGPLELGSHDEFQTLAIEMNAMCDRLREATRRVEQETSARITALEQLRHADRLRTVGLLASGIAHELGTPLNVVSARAEMIAAGECSSQEAIGYGRVIADAAERMTKIIRQVLAFARRKSPQKAPRDLVVIARDTCELLEPLADKNQVRLALRDPSKAFMVEVDANGIEQALTNIVVNAVHAMPGGGAVEVTLSEESRPATDEHPGRFVAIRVEDTGSGIAKEHLPRIFEPFFTTKDVGDGTGLGLSVTHGIIQDHGGLIEVESELGKGSAFTVHLPMREPS